MPSSADPPPRPGRAWTALAALLAVGAAALHVAGPATASVLDWQPALWLREPWRAWTAAWVHLSDLHLAVNLLGAALVGALGPLARLPRRTALAWLLAWPLTHVGLLAQPAVAHYGGLSGVLHAGVAAAALHLVRTARGPRRGIGAALLGGLMLKVLLEDPAGPPLRHPEGWDIATVPLAHACGLVAGLLASGIAESMRHRPTTIGADG